MKRLMALTLLAIAATADTITLPEAIGYSEAHPSLRAAEHSVAAYTSLYDAARADNYPSLDLAYSGTYLKEEPVVYMQNSFPGLPPGTQMQVQSQNRYTGALRLTYPLFTGFAVSASIDMARLQMQRAALEVEDARRNLLLGVIQAYTTALAMRQLQTSQQRELEAIEKSYAKAKGFYELQLLPVSELSRIEADLHAAKARTIQTANRYKTALSQLSMLTQHPVTGVGTLPETGELDLKTLTEEALRTRPDLAAVRLDVKKRQQEITLAKSGYYPTVSLYAQAAYQGDGPELDGDGYTNKDQSAAGFRLSYNLFSGFKTQSRTEAAREAQLAAKSALQAYTDRVKTELQQSFLTWQSFRQLREAAAAQVKAQQKYEAYVKGQFDNQLADADELSRAIAASAMARARLIDVHARLFLAYSRTLLHVNNDRLLKALHLSSKD